MEDYKNWHPNFPVTLATCQDEPIHIPGAIQTFGFLIGFNAETQRIETLSENAAQYIPELAPFEKQVLKLQDFFDIKEPSSILNLEQSESTRRLVEVEIKKGDYHGFYYGARYVVNNTHVLEVELAPISKKTDAHYFTNLPLMMRETQRHSDPQGLAEFVVKKIKQITGFDRVMLYRYDRDWNGEVIAEAKEEKLEAFLGLHYPASDIPPQARALYEKNWIRIIPTIDYRPSRLLPEKFQNLDLSHSLLRSVSPIHIRYLRNMGVGASMSISLIIDGKLWGLIACHHYSKHYVPLDVRLGCEAYGQLISWQIKNLESALMLKAQLNGENTLHRVLEKFGEMENFKSVAMQSEKDLLRLFRCSGIVIRLGDQVAQLGEDPGEIFCSAVAKTLINRTVLEPLVTNEIQTMPGLKDLAPTPKVSGMMALALSPKHNYYVVCVRPEEKYAVNWAGNPNLKNKIDFDNPDQRLQPRGSFALWAEMHENQSLPWETELIELLKKFGLLFFKIVIERKEIVERSNNELKMLNQAKDEFVATVSHELRTPLNAIIGWTDLALSGELETKKIPEALKIIQRNARSQNQLVADLLDVSRIISGKMKISVRNMRVTEVVEAVILSFTPAADAKSIKIISHLDSTADSIIGDPERVQQVVWNILSNAIKFSPKSSKIWITVQRKNSHMSLQIQDEGVGLQSEDFGKIFGRFQQVDSSAARKAGGLGLGLAISKHIVELHGGYISVSSDGLNRGTTFTVYFPIAPVLPAAQEDKMPIDDAFNENPREVIADRALTNQVILIVEDEPDASNFLNLLLKAHGAKTYVAFNGVEAMQMLKQHEDITIVLSDVGMPLMDGHQLAREIRGSSDKRISSMNVVALTAFGRPHDRVTALKSGFDSYIAKPVMQDELIAVLESISIKR